MLSCVSNKDLFLGCVGANIFLSVSFQFMMSMRRIKNVKKGGDFNCLNDEDEAFGIEQLLCSEYAPQISVLQLGLLLKYGSNNNTVCASGCCTKIAALLAVVATVTRYIFHLRSFGILPPKFVPPFMISCYLSIFGSSLLLMAPSCGYSKNKQE